MSSLLLTLYMKLSFIKGHFTELRANCWGLGGWVVETLKNQAGDWIYEESLLNMLQSFHYCVFYRIINLFSIY